MVKQSFFIFHSEKAWQQMNESYELLDAFVDADQGSEFDYEFEGEVSCSWGDYYHDLGGCVEEPRELVHSLPRMWIQVHLEGANDVLAVLGATPPPSCSRTKSSTAAPTLCWPPSSFCASLPIAARIACAGAPAAKPAPAPPR